MKTFKKSFVLFLFISLFFPFFLVSQTFEDFEKSVLVDIPGDNYDFDLLSSGLPYPFYDFYITWVNNTDSIYTVYLKKVTPETLDSNIIISSDNMVKSNPEINYNSSGPGISIVWENFAGSIYQIVRRDYSDGLLYDQVILKDSLSEAPQITMSYNHLAWVMDGSLYLKELFPDTRSPVLIDSAVCSSPSLVPDSWGEGPLLYEKLINGNRHIYLAEYEIYPDSHWVYFELSDGDNRNPAFGVGWGAAFELIEDGISRIKYYPYCDPESIFFISENTTCNYKNPDVFSYLIPTDKPDEDTPFFVAFDTDSLENNNEVMLKTFFFPIDELIDLSDMPGDDLKPKADVMLYNNVAYVVIIWEHQDNNHSSIWMAKTIFHPAGGVKDNVVDLSSFELLQNYPNPFNPVTNIEYSLKQGADVKVIVFDVLGNRITTLVDGYEAPGNHKIIFDGTRLSTGVYFYSIEVNRLQKTKSMILLR